MIWKSLWLLRSGVVLPVFAQGAERGVIYWASQGELLGATQGEI